MNVNWALYEGGPVDVMLPGDTAGDGTCEGDQHGVCVDDVVVYAADAAGLREFALNLLAALPPAGDGAEVATDD
jgi:hypothetical protein